MLLAVPTVMFANLRDSLVSNYGNWMNLTDGYTADHSDNHQKMDVAIDGNTIHLLWVEFTKRGDRQYGVWYRRSTDLGKTWEDAHLIATTRTDDVYTGNAGAEKRLMAVSNGRVHIVLINNHTWDTKETEGLSHLLYLRSDDGGKNFTTKKLGSFDSDYYSYSAAQIACDGSLVVIGAQNRNGNNEMYYYTSKDGGNSFHQQEQTVESGDTPRFLDLQASNGRWASMIWTGRWYSGLVKGDIIITSSDGSTLTE